MQFLDAGKTPSHRGALSGREAGVCDAKRQHSDRFNVTIYSVPPLVATADTIVIGSGRLAGVRHRPGSSSAVVDCGRAGEASVVVLFQDVGFCQICWRPAHRIESISVCVVNGI